jgi:S1-C subfamily serine protease
VVTLDNEIVPAKLVGADPIFDLAVIRSNQARVRPAGDSTSCGRAKSSQSATHWAGPGGHARHRERAGCCAQTPLSLTEPLIQTDTAINPGTPAAAAQPLQ